MQESTASPTRARSTTGDKDATLPPQWSRFSELYERYGVLVYRVCAHIMRCDGDARDAARETFATICRLLPSLPADANVVRWVHMIAIESCLNVAKRSMTERRASAPVA